MESRIVPDTVQLIVDVAGLCSSAPALEVTRPAGMEPRRSAEGALVPLLTQFFALDVGERTRHALIGVVHRLVDGRPVFGGEAVFLVPDVQRCFLERNRIDVLRLYLHDGIHVSAALRLSLARLLYGSQGITARAEFAERRLPGLPARRSCSRNPLNLPDRAIWWSRLAGTRSCVGVQSLMSTPARVKILGHI